MWNPKLGTGFLNDAINKLPIELHIPGYQYCGPGTKLARRLNRGDPGINNLDRACKSHDIAYSKFKSIDKRHEADKELSEKAWERFKSSDASFGEKATALAVNLAMRAKMKLGGRLRSNLRKKKQRNRKKKKKKTKCFKSLVSATRKVLRNKKVTKSSLLAAIRRAKAFKNRNKITCPRVIPIPKTGGVLPLVPIFAGLSALGALSSGVSNIVKTVKDLKNAREMLSDSKRHDRMMESIAIGKKGSGLYLRPYKNGYGLYLRPYETGYGLQSKNF